MWGRGGWLYPLPTPLLVLTTLVFARRLRVPIDSGLLTGFGNRPDEAGVGRPPRSRSLSLTHKYSLFIVISTIKTSLLSLRKWSPIQGQRSEFFSPLPSPKLADKRGCKYSQCVAGRIANFITSRGGRLGRGRSWPRSTLYEYTLLMSLCCRLNPRF